MTEEAFGWLFVGDTPLLYDKKRVARQFQVESWLDLIQVLRELGIEKADGVKAAAQPLMNYVV